MIGYQTLKSILLLLSLSIAIIILSPMSFKYHYNRNYYQDSKQIFFTPKLSLEGRNLFPQISDTHTFHQNRDQPFLNILKKPIMSLYQRVQIRNEKKPVCIVGMPKEVEIRHVRTGNMKKTRQEMVESLHKIEALSTVTTGQMKTQNQFSHTQSRQILKMLPVSNPEGGNYYILGPGNNKQLIEQILSRREGWFPTNSSIFHFRWEQARPKFQNPNAPHKQVINHLPGHQVISDKGNLFFCLKNYCEKYEQNLHKIIPVSFILDFSSEEIEEELKRFMNFYVECLSPQQVNNPQEQKKEESKRQRSASKRRTTQNQLFVNLESPKKAGKAPIKNSPVKVSKNKNDGTNNEQIKSKQQLKTLYKSLITILRPFHNFQDMSAPKKESVWVTPLYADIYGESSLWLLKPSDLNRGRGIKLFRTVQQLGQMLKGELQRHEKGSFIVQKYLERPLLLGGRKFDIRVWAMVTQQKQVYFFQEGYLRLSSQNFTLDSSSLFTHLTNNAVQKHATNYGQFEEGNILPISYLSEQGFIQKDKLYSQIKRIITLSIRAAGAKLYVPSDKNHSISVGNSQAKQAPLKTKYFQIFGYDFMVDCAKHVWLIEVNTNPCIELSNKWLATIIPRMLDDAFKLTLDRIFPKKKPYKEDSFAYQVKGYPDELNMWQLLESNEGEVTPIISSNS